MLAPSSRVNVGALWAWLGNVVGYVWAVNAYYRGGFAHPCVVFVPTMPIACQRAPRLWHHSPLVEGHVGALWAGLGNVVGYVWVVNAHYRGWLCPPVRSVCANLAHRVPTCPTAVAPAGCLMEERGDFPSALVIHPGGAAPWWH